MLSLVVTAALSFALPGHVSPDLTDNVIEHWCTNEARDLGWGSEVGPSGYVLVMRDGREVCSRAWGLSNRARDLTANADTRFRIGSLTKQFTAAAVMKLVEDGRVKLDDPLNTYVPFGDAGAHITLHHLLSHTSGIANYTDNGAFMAHTGEPHTREQMLDVIRKGGVQFSPGSTFRYSNSNYYLLGLVIEKASGESYADYLQKHVLAPAHLAHTGTVDDEGAPNTAIGYAVDPRTSAVTIAAPVDMSVPFAAGTLRSTAHDLARFETALFAGDVVSADSLKRMTTTNLGQYGYGLIITKLGDEPAVLHTGGINGFASFLGILPESHIVVVTLSNATEDNTLGQLLLQTIGEGKPPKLPPLRTGGLAQHKDYARVLGHFTMTSETSTLLVNKLPKVVLDSIATLDFAPQGEQLVVRFAGQGPFALRSDERGLYIPSPAVTFDVDNTTPVSTVTVHQGPLTLQYTRASL
jgi:CubicO group peptidase (beta-lactamase class C family)